MLYLPTPSSKELNAYFDLIQKSIRTALGNSSIAKGVGQYLELKLKEIITDAPDKLFNHHEEVMRLMIPDYKRQEYNKYLNLTGKRKLTAHQRQTVKKYRKVRKLANIFNYDTFLSGRKSKAYGFAQKLNRNTCTYCNRIYTTTVVVKDGATGRVSDRGRITRPQFDHWFAKSAYPLLALSYYNLIPSCAVCNVSVKGDMLFSRRTHIHPYEKCPGQDFTFTYRNIKIDELSVEIIPKGKKIQNTLKDLMIKEVYDMHSYLDLKDLYELRYKYSENYLETLFGVFDKLEVSEKEAYRLVFGVESDENEFHKRPFSKFKKDILAELGIKL